MDKPNRKEFIVKDKPGSCSECSKYRTCVIPCDRVELWADQDYIGRNSNIVMQNRGSGQNGANLSNSGGFHNVWIDYVNSTSAPIVSPDDFDSSYDTWERVVGMRLSERITRFIYSYYVCGKRIRDIAIDENATSQAIDRRHHQARMSIKNRLDREAFWLKIVDLLEYRDVKSYDMALLFFNHHYPRRVVARIIGVHPSTVLKNINKQNKSLERRGI